MAYTSRFGYTAAGGNPMYYDFNKGIADMFYGGGSGAATTTAPPGSSGGTTSNGLITGNRSSNYNPAFGGVPSGVPDPSKSYADAIAANASNLDAKTKYGSDINKFNLSEALKQYTAFGLDPSLEKARSNTYERLYGKVPFDVKNLLINSAAERGIRTGSPGSQNANSAYLRALGLTSIGLQDKGMNDLATLASLSPKVGLYDVTKGDLTGDEMQKARFAAELISNLPDEAAKFNALLQASQAGMSRGYNAARQSVPGGGGSNFLSDIMNRYNPFGSTATGTGAPPTSAPPPPTSPGVSYGGDNYYYWEPDAEGNLYPEGGSQSLTYGMSNPPVPMGPWVNDQDYWDALSGTGIYE